MALLPKQCPSTKSFQSKDGPRNSIGRNQKHNFRGKSRKNETHESSADLGVRRYKKSACKEAKESYLDHALMVNRNVLIIDGTITHATGTAEREATVGMLPKARWITVAGYTYYDPKDFFEEQRAGNATPHVAQNVTSNVARRFQKNLSLRHCEG